MKFLNRHTVIITAFMALLPSLAVSAEYEIGNDNSFDTVYFNSTAKLEFIEGKTNNISGHFNFDYNAPESGISGTIKVDLKTLKTGIETRDEHMRENHLHTEKYPFAFFEIDSVAPMPSFSRSDSEYTAIAIGKFYIHGVHRTINPEIEVVKSIGPGGSQFFQIRAKFSINLDNYKIPRPKALFLKLAETIEVEVVFRAFQSNSFDPIELPEWPNLD